MGSPSIDSNALKFTPPGGKVTIIVNQLPDEDLCEIIVRDTGIGVSSDKVDKLFDRFYQVDPRNFLKHENFGSGIGLSIVKNLVELHKGQISVESVQGEFTLSRMVFKTGNSHLLNNNNITLSEDLVPFSSNIHERAIKIESDESSESQTINESKNKIRILIVEDNYQLGFSDPLYFSKYFKKEVGLAPQQYRKEQ